LLDDQREHPSAGGEIIRILEVHNRIKKALEDLFRGAEMIHGRLAAMDDTDYSSRAFLVHLQKP
jgi:hypothetical protein